MKHIAKALLLSCAVSLAGCATTEEWRSSPDKAEIDRPQYAITLQPKDDQWSTAKWNGYTGFILTVVNKSDKNIELNWNKTLFVRNGQTAGGFMFEGVIYSDRNDMKQPDVIFASSSMTKVILPSVLAEYTPPAQYTSGGWKNEKMPPGEVGAFLTLVVDGKEIGERLGVRLTYDTPPTTAAQ